MGELYRGAMVRNNERQEANQFSDCFPQFSGSGKLLYLFIKIGKGGWIKSVLVALLAGTLTELRYRDRPAGREAGNLLTR